MPTDNPEAMKAKLMKSPLADYQSGNSEQHPLKRMLEYNSKWADRADAQLLAQNAKGQSPKVLWLGCADSRIPESHLCGTNPGEVFVHRNIANCFHPGDPSATAVLAYAIEHLGVEHVVVVGHYGCGGVKAAMAQAKDRTSAKADHTLKTNGQDASEAPSTTYIAPPNPDDEGDMSIGKWLGPIRAQALAQLRAQGPSSDLSDEEAERMLVRSHCCAQVSNIESSSIVEKAARNGKKITVDGWVYDVATGRLVDLNV